MGYLLKEALKTLCGVNQWSYAVFWKIGCQNPKLLIWEECYYEPLLCPLTSQASGIGRTEMDLRQWEGSLLTQLHSGQPEIQARERIQLLIDQMMIKNQINIVGEGIIGRAAFTGHHEWILAKSYNKDAHPPEVLNEMQNQFSAGMQTVAVIPVSPHGVVQLGSSLSLTENLGFINDVKSLILQLGCIPGALFSDGYAAKVGLPGSLGIPSIYPSDNIKVISPNSLMSDHCKQLSSSSRPAGSATHQSPLVRHMNEVSTLAYQTSDQFPTSCVSLGGECYPKVPTAMKRSLPFEGQSDMGKVGAELFPADLDMLLNQNMGSCKGRNQMNHQPDRQPGGNGNDSDTVHKRKFSDGFIGNLLNSTSSSSGLTTSQLRANDVGTRNTCGGFESTASFKGEFLNGTNGYSRKISPQCCPSDTLRTACANIDDFKLQDCDSSNLEGVPLFRMTGQTTNVKDPVHSPASAWVSHPADTECMKNEHTSVELLPDWIYNFEKHDCGSQSTITSVKFEDMSFQKYSSGNDLFDMLGMEFKNKVIGGNFPSLVADGPDSSSGRMRGDIPVGMNVQEAGFGLNPMGEGFLDESVFSGAGGDHLLDAVVSKAQSVSKQGSDDNLSCKTTVTKISSSSVPSSSPTYHGVSDHMEREMTGYPKPLEKLGNPVSCSFKSSCSKEGPCSPSNSFYGSQISSWVEQSHAVKVESSVSTAYSKKPDGTTKSNRKRLKPGENPRPRPKDRQMIQDRVKELREIVPNGAKCSIDALLERTIKHMLFLQSVTKHADKLKESGESKIINKEGGLLLKDNFEGGATWAFEVGSQSMVCPIIVEDLNPPRQMLVEMLCEDRGFFLEIADMIRGLGLTILKGVMEARNDKIWARFAVEANRDVTRMEIFMSLVRLLEQTVKGGPLAAKAIESNQTVHNSFAQATSIPATSRPN